MKNSNSRRILIVIIALFGAVGLVIISAAASVFAYRQFVGNGQDTAFGEVLEGLQAQRTSSDDDQGVVILRVEPGSPAEAAGLESGVIINSINGRAVNNPQELKDAIAEYEVGDTVTLTVQDGEETRDVSVTLGDSGPYLGVNVGSSDGSFRFHGGRFDDMPHGFVVPGFPDSSQDPDAPEGMMPFEFDFDEFGGPHGRFFDLLGKSALVMSVEGQSPAAAAGLEAGDAIVEANGQTIENSRQLIDLVSGMSPGDELSLQVQRGEETISIKVILTDHPELEGRAYLGVFLAPAGLQPRMEFFQEQQSS